MMTDEDDSKPSADEPVLLNDMVEFSVDPIQKQLVCPLCSGYFREPYTVSKCLHTFCKSCLFYAISQDHFTCPTCETYLGKDALKLALPDRTLQNLIDKVLFPDMARRDKEQEVNFYLKRGISRKPEYWTDEDDDDFSSDGRNQRRRKLSVDETDDADDESYKEEVGDEGDNDNEMLFHLVPMSQEYHISPPALNLPVIQTDRNIKIAQLKKYLALKLGIRTKDPKKSFEILCNNTLLGDEMSVNFVFLTVWKDRKRPLKLRYRYANAHEETKL